MVLFFLFDIITSTALYITIKCGTWIVYGTANGVYYIYKKISHPVKHDSSTDITIRIDDANHGDSGTGRIQTVLDDDDCVILTRGEYQALVSMHHVKIE